MVDDNAPLLQERSAWPVEEGEQEEAGFVADVLTFSTTGLAPDPAKLLGDLYAGHLGQDAWSHPDVRHPDAHVQDPEVVATLAVLLTDVSIRGHLNADQTGTSKTVAEICALLWEVLHGPPDKDIKTLEVHNATAEPITI